MSRLALRTLIGRQNDAASVIAGLAETLAPAVVIEDCDGRPLIGSPLDGQSARYPVMLDGERLGWVHGGPQAEAVAALVGHLARKELERRTLGSEVLHLYREVNLIYSFSESLAALLDLHAVSRLALAQARQLIAATDGAVMLRDGDGGDRLESIEGFGDGKLHPSGLGWGDGLIGAIAARGNAEIVNDARDDPRYASQAPAVASLLCAPLRVGERVTGAIVLGNATPVVYTAAELKLLNTLALQTATAIENARLFERTISAARERERLLAVHQELEVARARLEREMELAASIQANLFPAALPALPGYDLAVRNRPARRCGGDYYDVLPLGGNGDAMRFLLCVADVSGKGLPASLLMSNTQATLRALIGRVPSLAALAAEANDLLYASTSDSRYVTAALLEILPATGSARYLGAGHTSSLLLRGTGEAVWLESTGTPLGLFSPGIPCSAHPLDVAPGDCLALFSDGVTEAQNANGDEFGEERLLGLVRSGAADPARAIVSRVFDEIDRFAGDAPQFDDITLMILKRL
jgi:serine phosphatase RsbU (regulator of sigma subunit)